MLGCLDAWGAAGQFCLGLSSSVPEKYVVQPGAGVGVVGVSFLGWSSSVLVLVGCVQYSTVCMYYSMDGRPGII